jgi:ATP-dependent helicase HrpB
VTQVRSAARVEAEELVDALPELLEETVEVEFQAEGARVEAFALLRWNGLTLERRRLAGKDPRRSAALRDEVRRAGVEPFFEPGALATYRARVAFAATHGGHLRAPQDAEILELLLELCDGLVSFAELRALDPLALLESRLPTDAARDLARLAPTHVTLPGGRRAKLQWEPDRPPWIASRLQDFFGSTQGPMLPDGTPVVLHLLAPNQRAVQVTTDLAGFWERHYPQLRPALQRRYPRHAWPDDPRRAAPPAPRR